MSIIMSLLNIVLPTVADNSLIITSFFPIRKWGKVADWASLRVCDVSVNFLCFQSSRPWGPPSQLLQLSEDRVSRWENDWQPTPSHSSHPNLLIQPFSSKTALLERNTSKLCILYCSHLITRDWDWEKNLVRNYKAPLTRKRYCLRL